MNGILFKFAQRPDRTVLLTSFTEVEKIPRILTAKVVGIGRARHNPSGLNSFHQVTEVNLGRVMSNSGWVTSKA